MSLKKEILKTLKKGREITFSSDGKRDAIVIQVSSAPQITGGIIVKAHLTTDFIHNSYVDIMEQVVKELNEKIDRNGN